MIKKLVSLLLIMAIMLTVLPAAALAGELDPTAVTLEPEESEIVEPIPGTNITEAELEEVLVGLFGAMEADNSGASASGDANYAVNYAYVERTASQDIIDFIMVHENSIQESYKPMWDVSQWSIGFGSRCPSSPSYYKNPADYTVNDFPGSTPEEKEENMEIFMGYWKKGMPLEEAEQLLYDFVNETFGPAVNRIADKYNITLSQQEFDALVDFSYALGDGWGGGCRLLTGLNQGFHGQSWTTANDLSNPGWYFINGVGSWCHVSGAANHGAATRRVQELEIFQYGDYYGNYYYDQVDKGHPIHYTYLLFDANGGTRVQPANMDWSSSNRFYFVGSPYTNLISATREGYRFDGWFTEKTGGTQITEDTIAEANRGSYAGITVYAHWTKLEGGFTDVSASDWFYNEVNDAVDLGLMNGTAPGTFKPESTLTRGMVVTILHRMAGNPAPNGSNPFRDVAAGRYYTKAIVWAYENGIANGFTPTTFRPDSPVTRQELATFLYRFAAINGENISYDALSGYNDQNLIKPYAFKAMSWAVSNGMINGQSSTRLAPLANSTRAEAAAIFVRYADQFN